MFRIILFIAVFLTVALAIETNASNNQKVADQQQEEAQQVLITKKGKALELISKQNEQKEKERLNRIAQTYRKVR